jgi:hypothetical protein
MTAVWDNFIGPLQMSNRYNIAILQYCNIANKKLLIALIHKKSQLPHAAGIYLKLVYLFQKYLPNSVINNLP